MKADVTPTPANTLVIPSWVPDVIAQAVSAQYAADVDQAYKEAPEMLEHGDMPLGYTLAYITGYYRPLTCDSRMKSVWRELPKRGSNGGFLHPAIGVDQDTAMLQLFEAAWDCQIQRKITVTQRRAKQQRDYYLTKANELRNSTVWAIWAFETSSDKFDERCQKLEDAAKVYEDIANEIYATHMPMALERMHDGHARAHWVALAVGGAFRKLFKKQMSTLTATITSVVIDREIEPETVKKWLKATL